MNVEPWITCFKTLLVQAGRPIIAILWVDQEDMITFAGDQLWSLLQGQGWIGNRTRAETIPRVTRIKKIIKANYVPRRIVLSIY